MKFKSKEIKESRAKALEEIKKFLEAPDVDGQFSERSGEYFSKDKFIVTWKGNYRSVPSEFRIDKCDAFYAGFSGCKAIYCAVGLFHEKQLKGFPSIERALIEIGIGLCENQADKLSFYHKYALPYNRKIVNITSINE